MDYEEFLSWAIYYGIEPWGTQIEGVRLASINSAVYNAGLMSSNPKRLKSSPFRPEQFYVGIHRDAPTSGETTSWREKRKTYDKLFGEAIG